MKPIRYGLASARLEHGSLVRGGSDVVASEPRT